MLRLRLGASRRGSPTSDGSSGTSSRAAPLRELRRRVDPRLPLPAGGRRAVPRRRDGARRAGGAVAALVLASYAPFTQYLVVARLCGRGAERARLDRLREAVRASRRRARCASTRCAISRRCTAGSRRGRRSTARARCSTGARTAATWCSAALAFQPELWAAGIELRRHLEPRHVPREHVAVPAGRARAGVRLALHDRDFLVEASPMTRIDAIRAPLFIQHGANDPRVPVGESEQIAAVLTGEGDPLRARDLRGRRPHDREAREPHRLVHPRGRVPRRGARAASAAGTMAALGRLGRVVRQRPAKPRTPVRLW